MPLTFGDRLGPYQIIAPLGAGGMGEVYRASDSRLGRQVAVKVLPETLAADPDRMARFQREAHALASLNHPNIAAIYGLEDRALIMELVEGPTLADRIAASPMPLNEALPVARQIAEALEYAHEKGVVHRDLKPANVKITPEGVVRVLDFGLAKVAEQAMPADDPANAPTLTMRSTQAGVIMGTAAYMSPEQASGKPVDKRSDIWSFGVVLCEMLCGRPLFDAETLSHTLADVLRGDIDVNKLPAGTPAIIRDLVRRCLDRDVKNRLRDIGEARISIQSYLTDPAKQASPGPAVVSPRRPLAWVAAAFFCALIALTISLLHFRESPSDSAPVTLSVLPPDKHTFDNIAVSPSGRLLAFTAADYSAGKRQLWVRPLDSLSAQPMAGTDGASNPFWSPDSRFIGFFAEGILKKIEASGGPPQTICSANDNRGGAWSRDGVILFAGNQAGPLYSVPAAGGQAKALTDADDSQEITESWPCFLPAVDTSSIRSAARNGKSQASTSERWNPRSVGIQRSDPAVGRSIQCSVRFGAFGRIPAFRA